MARRNEYVDWLVEQLQPLGPVRAKGMFGGWGFYLDDLFFALAADDVFYVKVDEETRARFTEEGLQPFRYPMKDGREVEMSYYTLPDPALEDPSALCQWARFGVEAALRARAAGKGKRKKTG